MVEIVATLHMKRKQCYTNMQAYSEGKFIGAQMLQGDQMEKVKKILFLRRVTIEKPTWNCFSFFTSKDYTLNEFMKDRARGALR